MRVLVVDGSSVRGKRLLDAVRKAHVEIPCLPIVKDADRIAFARAEIQGEGRTVTQGALRALAEAFANDPLLEILAPDPARRVRLGPPMMGVLLAYGMRYGLSFYDYLMGTVKSRIKFDGRRP